MFLVLRPLGSMFLNNGGQFLSGNHLIMNPVETPEALWFGECPRKSEDHGSTESRHCP